MHKMERTPMLKMIILAALFLALAAPVARAQSNTDLGAVITNALRTPGTVTSNQQTNVDGNGVVCVFSQTAVSGSPSTTFKIQGFDAANNSYYDLAVSGAVTALNTPTALTVHPGVIAADAISPAVAKSTLVPAKWRVSQTITGAGTAVTGKIGCNKLK